MKYGVVLTKDYRKSLKKLRMSGRFSESKLQSVINILAGGDKLDLKYQDHGLAGQSEGYRERHVQPDLLLIYKIENNRLVLVLTNIGSHSDLFG